MLTFYNLFRERFRSLDESEKIIKQINEKLDASTETVNPKILYPLYYILNTDPCYYWDDSIRKNTLLNLENLNINNPHTIVINNDILNHFFIGYTDNREDILNIINQSVEWLKKVKNIASPKLKIIHGDMEAESIYINVYRHDSRKNKDLFNNNENFVCFVDYNKNNKTTLDHGGLPVKIWNKYYHEKIKNIRIAWRTNDYILTNIGRNDTCPCCSGKKYKKCCLL